MMQQGALTGVGISFSEMSSFFKEQQEATKADKAELTRELKHQQSEMEARLDAKDAKTEQLRKEMEAKIAQQQALIHQQELLKAELAIPPACASDHGRDPPHCRCASKARNDDSSEKMKSRDQG